MALLKKFGALGGMVLGVIGLILVLATDGVVNGNSGLEGTKVIFGYKVGGYTASKPTVVLIIAFIGLVFALLMLLVAVLGQLAKVSALEKLAPRLALSGGALLLLAAVLFALTVPSYLGAQNAGNVDGFGIGAGYVIAVICFACGGCLAVLPKFVK